MKSDDEYVREMLQKERGDAQRLQQLAIDEKALLLEQIRRDGTEPSHRYHSVWARRTIPLWKAYWKSSEGYLFEECYISSSGDLYEMRKVESKSGRGMDISIIPASSKTKMNFGENMLQHRQWVERMAQIKLRSRDTKASKWWRFFRRFSS